MSETTTPSDTNATLLFFINVAVLVIVSVFSQRIGRVFRRIHLPMITGYLLTGLFIGPFVLGVIKKDDLTRLKFAEEICLSFIGLLAGSEFYLKEMRPHIKRLILGLILIGSFSFITGMGIIMFAGAVLPPFFTTTGSTGVNWNVYISAGLLCGAIAIARSPSSAVAVVNELRADGPFTRQMLGITILSDLAVIVTFAFCMSIAKAITGSSFSALFLVNLVIDLACAVVLGVALGIFLWLITLIGFRLHRRWPTQVRLHYLLAGLRLIVICACGYGIYRLDEVIHNATQELYICVYIEPLLIFMVAGFCVVNFTHLREEFHSLLQLGGPLIYILFFTYTGASLDISVLASSWWLALLLFAARVVAIFLATALSSLKHHEPAKHVCLSWLGYLTQAGIGVGLAREVAEAFPTWGEQLSTTMIAAVFMNQIIGPITHKFATKRLGEVEHVLAEELGKVIIIGLDRQTIALANKLKNAHWDSVLVYKHSMVHPSAANKDGTSPIFEICEDAIDVNHCPMEITTSLQWPAQQPKCPLTPPLAAVPTPLIAASTRSLDGERPEMARRPSNAPEFSLTPAAASPSVPRALSLRTADPDEALDPHELTLDFLPPPPRPLPGPASIAVQSASPARDDATCLPPPPAYGPATPRLDADAPLSTAAPQQPRWPHANMEPGSESRQGAVWPSAASPRGACPVRAGDSAPAREDQATRVLWPSAAPPRSACPACDAPTASLGAGVCEPRDCTLPPTTAAPVPTATTATATTTCAPHTPPPPSERRPSLSSTNPHFPAYKRRPSASAHTPMQTHTHTHTHTHTRPAGEGAVLPEGVEWVSEFSKEELSRFVQNPTTDVLVCLLHNDHDNYRAAEVAVDDLGMTKVIVRVLDPRWAVQFQELGVLQVDPMSSMLNMLDHVVRSPASHSFISFNAPETELVHVTGVLPEHVGRQLQHLDWPHDVLVTSIVRGRDWMIPQATTVLEPGDQLILAGSADSIRDVAPPEATAPPPSPVVARRRKLNEQGLDATARPSPLRRTSKPPLPASTATSRLPRCAPLRRHSIGTTRPHLQRPPPWLSPSQAQSLAQGQASEATDRRE